MVCHNEYKRCKNTSWLFCFIWSGNLGKKGLLYNFTPYLINFQYLINISYHQSVQTNHLKSSFKNILHFSSKYTKYTYQFFGGLNFSARLYDNIAWTVFCFGVKKQNFYTVNQTDPGHDTDILVICSSLLWQYLFPIVSCFWDNNALEN